MSRPPSGADAPRVRVPIRDLDRTLREPGLARILASMRSPAGYIEVCPHCGWNLDRVLETRLLGCPLCYSVFAPAIERLLGSTGEPDGIG